MLDSYGPSNSKLVLVLVVRSNFNRADWDLLVLYYCGYGITIW